MKDSRKRWQPNSKGSVIATLIGFDEPRFSQSYKNKRLLSERYTRKVASLAPRPGSLVPARHLSSTKNEIVRSSKGKNANALDECANLRTSNVNNRTGENGKSLMLESGKPHHEVVVGSTSSLRHSCASCTRSMKRISSVEKHRSKFEELLKAGYKFYIHDSHLLPDQSSSPNKSSNQKFERWKKAKEAQDFEVSGRNQTLDEILASTDKKSMARNLDCLGGSGLCSPSSLQSRTTDCSSPSVYSRINDVGESGRKQLQTSLGPVDSVSPSSKVSEFSSCDFSCYGSSYNSAETYIQSIRDQIENYFEHDGCKESEPCPRNSESSISREASFNEFSEEETAYSSSGIGPLESVEKLKRTNQHSPDSVLESYDTKNLPSFESFDSIGLRLQLEALNFDSEESHSEGSMMGVSGEENSEEQFGDLSHGGRKLKTWPRDDDSRNYSYMVDVLDEAGFCYTNSIMDFNTWASFECPISPSTFDRLEKKYAKQTSWDYSERRLLFDRINSGLLSIFNPFINIYAGSTSMRRKLRSSFRRDEVEEELWMMLINEEDEKKSKDLFEKALEEWPEREEGISIICGELEASLFDELVMELTHF